MLGVLAFGACTNEDSLIEKMESVSAVPKVRIFDESMTKVELVRNAAIQFDLKQVVTRSEGGEREIKEIIPLNGEDGEPAMYVVNYAEDKGWVIISGTTDYTPILACNDTGNFDISNIDGNAVEIWVNETRSVINYMKTAPEKEKEKYQRQWLYYASKAVPLTDVVPMTRDDASEAFAYQNQCCAQWEAEGYDIYLLIAFMDSAPSFISTSLKNQIINEAYTYGTDQYDGVLYNSLVLFKSDTYNSTTIGPLISTTWDQLDYYGYYIPYFTKKYGCAPVAIAQIMRYWEYPNSFNWSSMSSIGYDQASCYLKYQVGSVCGIDYDSNDFGANINQARTAFLSFGYNHASIISHNSTTVRNNLNLGRPVYMRGNVAGNSSGHAWVCDGFREDVCNISVVLKALQTKSSFYSHDFGVVDTEYYTTFHMNWGYQGDDNGYYRDGAMYLNTSEISIPTSDRYDIVNIYH